MNLIVAIPGQAIEGRGFKHQTVLLQGRLAEGIAAVASELEGFASVRIGRGAFQWFRRRLLPTGLRLEDWKCLLGRSLSRPWGRLRRLNQLRLLLLQVLDPL
jgi:hypothetical protein